jgi:hypothetical protein
MPLPPLHPSVTAMREYLQFHAGDRVGIYLPQCPETLLAHVATYKLAGISMVRWLCALQGSSASGVWVQVHASAHVHVPMCEGRLGDSLCLPNSGRTPWSID